MGYAASRRENRVRELAANLPTLALGAVLLAVCLREAIGVDRTFPIGVDLDIPLRAAERWLQGQPPYLPSSFLPQATGRDQPFLYAPVLLPVLAPFSVLSRGPALVVGVLLCLAATLHGLRRLGIPAWSWPILLIWPPLLQAVWNANIQALLFAAFVAAFWAAPAVGPWRPRVRALDPAGLGPRSGILATFVCAVKVSQLQAWLLVLRHDRRGALVGAAVFAGLAVLALLFTGVGPWVDWLRQLDRAADPAWVDRVSPAVALVPAIVRPGLILGSLVAVLLLPARNAAAWTGLLLIVGSATIHVFTLGFALPAMLLVRREVGLLVAIAFATYDPRLEWLGLVALAVVLAASHRYPSLEAGAVVS